MYNENDLLNIEKAIADLQNGRRVMSVSYGDTQVNYASMTLDDLLKLRNQIKANLENATSNKRQVIFSTSKGLR